MARMTTYKRIDLPGPLPERTGWYDTNLGSLNFDAKFKDWTKASRFITKAPSYYYAPVPASPSPVEGMTWEQALEQTALSKGAKPINDHSAWDVLWMGGDGGLAAIVEAAHLFMESNRLTYGKDRWEAACRKQKNLCSKNVEKMKWTQALKGAVHQTPATICTHTPDAPFEQ